MRIRSRVRAVSRRKRLTSATAARPPSHQALKVSAAIAVPVTVAIALIALVAANDDGGGSAKAAPPSSTTTVTMSEAAKAFQTRVDDAFKPLGDAVQVFLPQTHDFETGKVKPDAFKGFAEHALPEYVKARDAIAKLPTFKEAPAVNRLFLDAADLYVEVARVYLVAADPGSDALRSQLSVSGRRLRSLADRVYDRGRVLLDPKFYVSPSENVEVRPPTEVPDWVAEGMAPGPPLADTPGPPPTSPPIREVTRPEQSEKKWLERVRAADIPQPADLAKALEASDTGRLRGLADTLTAKAGALRAIPDPTGGRERAAVAGLGLLVDAESARLGQAASLLPKGDAQARLAAAARRVAVVGDDLLEPALRLKPTGFDRALLKETGP